MVKRRKSKAKPEAPADVGPKFGPLENAVMRVLWKQGDVSAEDVRLALEAKHDLKDSTVRTLLRRLEAKGVVEHSVEGRAFVYRSKIEPEHLAAKAVRGIADQFCQGSMSSLLLGMADQAEISPEVLRELADQIEAAKASESKQNSKSAKKRNR